MAHRVKAVIAKEKNAPVSVETILVPDPGPGEVLVDILTCGVCHTDLHYKQGGITDDFPILLGHEATGVVSAVGPDVTDVAPGDRVILNWRAVCGQCRACAKGQPQYCFNTHNATQKMTLEDGTELSPGPGSGTRMVSTETGAFFSLAMTAFTLWTMSLCSFRQSFGLDATAPVANLADPLGFEIPVRNLLRHRRGRTGASPAHDDVVVVGLCHGAKSPCTSCGSGAGTPGPCP